MSVKKKRTIGPCRGVTWLYCCGHGISSLPFISILAFVPSFSSRCHFFVCFTQLRASHTFVEEAGKTWEEMGSSSSAYRHRFQGVHTTIFNHPSYLLILSE